MQALQEIFGQYYGMDWLATLVSLLSIYLIGDKNRYGFLVGIIASLAWVSTNVLAHIWPGIILNVVLIALYMRGYVKWGKVLI